MHSVITEPNNSDHKGHSYTIWVTKTGRLIMKNLKHICNTTITSEEYLLEQIKKALKQFEDILVQAKPREVTELLKPWSIGTATEVSATSLPKSQKESYEKLILWIPWTLAGTV